MVKITGSYVRGIKNGIACVASQGKNVAQEIKTTGKYYSRNIGDRWSAGERYAKKQNMGMARTVGTQVQAVVTGLRPKKEHIPATLGIIGTITPIPLGSVAGYGLGKVITKSWDAIFKNILGLAK